MRKIKAFRAGEIDITVEFDSVYQEYVVRLFNNGVENRDALRAALRHEADCVEAAKAEIEALRAKIEAMEKQEPVKHEYQGRDGVWYPFINQRHYENTVADGSWPVRALYALPSATEVGDKTERDAKYYTDDKEDAVGTARHMFKSFLSADI